MHWLKTLAGLVAEEGAAARVVIIGTDGPTPRAVGSDVIVTRGQVRGRIGRRDVQESAIALGRALIEEYETAEESEALWLRRTTRFPTGDVLGQPTGGSVTVLVEAFGMAEIEQIERRLVRVGHGCVAARPVAAGQPPLRPAPEVVNGSGRPADDASPDWLPLAARVASSPQHRLVRILSREHGDVVIEAVGAVRPPLECR